jgi:MoaA/NifB/PqqE/SkfB family radical SAM enzyme
MKKLDVKTGFICNNNCRFCVQADNKCTGNRTSNEIICNLKECANECDSVVFTGGEVSIRKDFIHLIEEARKIGYKTIQIQTNGRMFSDISFCSKVIKAGANQFSPAIHGYCKEQHDYLTRAQGSFQQTVKGIRNLKKLGAYILTNTVIVKSNYMDSEKMAKLLVKLDVDQFQFAFVHGCGNAWKNRYQIIPNMTIASIYMKKGLYIGINAGKNVMTEALPYCMMKGYEEYAAERIIPDTAVRGKEYQNTDDYGTERKTMGKVKFPQCKDCMYYIYCEGVWNDYKKMFGGEEFVAIRI